MTVTDCVVYELCLLLPPANICKYYNNNDDQNAPETSEMCQELYQVSGRCETDTNIPYPDSSACEFISTILPKLEGASKSLGLYSGLKNSNATAATVCAWVFGVLSLALGLYSFLLYRRLRRTKIALNPDPVAGGTMA